MASHPQRLDYPCGGRRGIPDEAPHFCSGRPAPGSGLAGWEGLGGRGKTPSAEGGGCQVPLGGGGRSPRPAGGLSVPRSCVHTSAIWGEKVRQIRGPHGGTQADRGWGGSPRPAGKGAWTPTVPLLATNHLYEAAHRAVFSPPAPQLCPPAEAHPSAAPPPGLRGLQTQNPVCPGGTQAPGSPCRRVSARRGQQGQHRPGTQSRHAGALPGRGLGTPRDGVPPLRPVGAHGAPSGASPRGRLGAKTILGASLCHINAPSESDSEKSANQTVGSFKNSITDILIIQHFNPEYVFGFINCNALSTVKI